MSSFTSFSMQGTEEGERKTINYYIEINEVCEMNMRVFKMLTVLRDFIII